MASLSPLLSDFSISCLAFSLNSSSFFSMSAFWRMASSIDVGRWVAWTWAECSGSPPEGSEKPFWEVAWGVWPVEREWFSTGPVNESSRCYWVPDLALRVEGRAWPSTCFMLLRSFIMRSTLGAVVSWLTSNRRCQNRYMGVGGGLSSPVVQGVLSAL